MHGRYLTLQPNGTRYLEIGKSIDFGLTQQVAVQCVDILTLQLFVYIDDMLQLIEEPTVYLRQVVNLVDGIFRHVHRLRNNEDALVCRFTQGGINIGNAQFLVLHETVHPLPYHAQSLLDSLLEVSSDGHHFAHRLHRRTQFLVHTVELREVPTGYLANHIVEGWFEKCRGSLRHRILQFEESVAHTQFGSYKSQGITCCL